MSTPAPTQPHPGSRAPGRALAFVAGSLVGLVAIALVVAGLALAIAHIAARDSAGFYTSPVGRFTTGTYAITSEGIQIGDVRGQGADWALNALDPTVRVRASAPSGRPVFIGIAPAADVDRYLARSAHVAVRDVHARPFSYDSVRSGGGAPPGVPATQTFWSASASGRGTQALTWRPAGGRWAVVVMNADGSRQVVADVSVGAKTDLVLPIAVVLLTAGVLALLASMTLVWLGARGGSGPAGATAAATASGATAERPYPLHFEARLDEPLSRWLWLVKWLLALPHWVVLAFLWIAYDVLTLVALFAILFTGRYPRALFDFNVGVLRWTWRVAHYALTLGTDRYPPFTLEPADYPAELDVPYPDRLSRGKALFKPWLLSIPHWLVVAVFLGWWKAPGLLPLLAVIGGATLLFTGRYQRDVFGLVTALARWVARVAVYAGLMRDEYPPFRLDR